MNRLQMRRPAGLRRRPVRARRVAAARPVSLVYSTPRPAPRGLVAGGGILGGLVLAELIVGLVIL